MQVLETKKVKFKVINRKALCLDDELSPIEELICKIKSMKDWKLKL